MSTTIAILKINEYKILYRFGGVTVSCRTCNLEVARSTPSRCTAR